MTCSRRCAGPICCHYMPGLYMYREGQAQQMENLSAAEDASRAALENLCNLLVKILEGLQERRLSSFYPPVFASSQWVQDWCCNAYQSSCWILKRESGFSARSTLPQLNIS